MYNLGLKDYVDKFWNYILHGTESIHVHKTFKASLHCAGDFGRTYKEQLFEREASLMGRLIRLIHEPIQR